MKTKEQGPLIPKKSPLVSDVCLSLKYQCSWVSDFDFFSLLRTLRSNKIPLWLQLWHRTNEWPFLSEACPELLRHTSNCLMDNSIWRLHRNFKLFMSRMSYLPLPSCVLPPSFLPSVLPVFINSWHYPARLSILCWNKGRASEQVWPFYLSHPITNWRLWSFQYI